MNLPANSTKTQQVYNEVPFGRSLYSWLRVRSMPLEQIASYSRKYDRQYLAWETVRKGRNPFFVKGTGFEGYIVGRCDQPEAALDAILVASQSILDRIARLYRYHIGFRALLLKTLQREASDPRAMHEWAAQLGATLAQMRCNLVGNVEAQTFQFRTYQVISQLPPISYSNGSDDLTQAYVIWRGDEKGALRLPVDIHMLKPSQQDAWLVAEAIGTFGHPLIREYLALQGSSMAFF